MSNGAKLVTFCDIKNDHAYAFSAFSDYDDQNGIAEFRVRMPSIKADEIRNRSEDFRVDFDGVHYPLYYTTKELNVIDSLVVGVKLAHDVWTKFMNPPTAPHNQICAAVGSVDDPQDYRTPFGYFPDIGGVHNIYL